MTFSERMLRWAVLIGVFLLPFVPLVVSSSLFFPYITGKNFLFRIIVEAITCAWLALALVNPAYRPRRNWIFGAFLIFIAIMAIADAQGVNPLKSFWSNYERMDGWVTIAHLFCYVVVAACVVNAEQLWRKLFELTIGISVFVDLYGFAQILGAVGLGEGGLSGLGARIDATFGNPIYLAVYMLFHIFLAALLIVQSGREKWDFWDRMVLPVGLFIGLLFIGASSGGALSWIAVVVYLVLLCVMAWLMFLPRRYILSLIIVLDIVALLFTGTRGTTFGLVGGSVLAGIIYIFFASDARRARPFVLGGIIALVVAAGGLWLARDTSAVQSVGFLDRMVAISPTETTVQSRILNIEMAWKGIKERPILGWGQENYAIVFDKYYDPRMYPDEPWFDRVHDIIFDWWVAGGTLGLLAYLGLLFSYVWVLWRSKAFTVAERSILTGLLAGYFIHNLTVFDNITSYILFGTVLAYIVFRANEAQPGKQIPLPTTPRGAAPALAIGAAVVALGVMWAVNAKAYEENLAILGGLSQESGGLAQNLAEFERAISYNTYGNQEAREQLAQVATEISSASSSQVSDDLKSQFLNEAVQQLELQEKVSPLDARNPLFIGTLLDAYGQYAAASPFLQQAHGLSLDKQEILYEMAMNAQAQGDTADALSYFQEAYQVDTQDTDALLYYAAEAITAKNDALAEQLLAPYITNGEAADPRIAAAYASRGEYSKIVPIWQAHIAADPTDTQAYFTLAAAYYESGQSNQAIQVLEAAGKEDPSSASQVEALIQQVKSGTAKVQ